MTEEDEGAPKIINVDSALLNRLVYKLISDSFPKLDEDKISQMVTQAAETAGKTISSGIENSLVGIADRIIEQQAAITPIEREVDMLLIYNVFNSESATRNRDKKYEQPFESDFGRFLNAYADKRKYGQIRENNHLRKGIATKFEDPISEKDASKIIGIEALWVLHNNTRYLIYDGNFYFSPAMIERLQDNKKFKEFFGVVVSTNLIRGEQGPLLVTTVPNIEKNGCIAADRDYIHKVNSPEGKDALYLNITRLSKK